MLWQFYFFQNKVYNFHCRICYVSAIFWLDEDDYQLENPLGVSFCDGILFIGYIFN